MRKIIAKPIILSLTGVIAFLFSAKDVEAGPVWPPPTTSHAVNFGTINQGIPFDSNNGLFAPLFATHGLGYLILTGIIIALAIAGLLLLLYLIYGGFQLMTSSGNPDKVKGAKEILTHAVMGFLIIFISYWLVQLTGLVFGITEVQRTFR